MRLAAAACLALLAGTSCSRFHASSSAMYARSRAAKSQTPPPIARDTTAGFVVDAEGQPVRARVAAVSASGSLSVMTDRAGRFEFTGLAWNMFTVQASADGRFAIQSRVVPGTGDIRLALAPAATLTIELAGDRPFRCALLQGAVHLDDVTIRPGEPALVVVPPGEIVVRLYDGAGVQSEQTVAVAVGDRKELGFGPLSALLEPR